MPVPIKVLSIQQPFADFVFHIGKWCENRSWRTNYRGLLYIHASKLNGCEVAEWRAKGLNLREYVPMATGAIIGRVDLVDCVPFHELLRFAPKAVRDRQTLWFGNVSTRAKIPPHLESIAALLRQAEPDTWQHVAFDPEGYAWILTDPELLAEPVPAKGRLNVWEHPWDPRLEAFQQELRAKRNGGRQQ